MKRILFTLLLAPSIALAYCAPPLITGNDYGSRASQRQYEECVDRENARRQQEQIDLQREQLELQRRALRESQDFGLQPLPQISPFSPRW